MNELIQVYRNLHKKCWSVRNKNTGKVIAHPTEIYLQSAKFIVNESGRQRVLREMSKNVHAMIEGVEILNPERLDLKKQDEVLYNPYKYESFMVRLDHRIAHNPIYDARYVMLDSNGRVFVMY